MVSMGDEIRLGNGVTLQIRMPQKAECRLIQNGEVIRTWRDQKSARISPRSLVCIASNATLNILAAHGGGSSVIQSTFSPTVDAMPVANNVTRFLDFKKIKYTAFELPADKLGAQETARRLGVPAPAGFSKPSWQNGINPASRSWL